MICQEGEPGDALFLIRSGHAAIFKGSADAPIVLTCRGAGEFVGEMAILEDLPRSASVVALEEVQLIKMTRDDFQRLLSDSTKLDIGMLRKLSSRLREADDLITTTTHARRTLHTQVNELAAENQELLDLQRLRAADHRSGGARSAQSSTQHQRRGGHAANGSARSDLAGEPRALRVDQ